MKTITIQVPEGVKYLSQWDKFDELLPTGQHCILDKAICGIGATEAYIRNKGKVVITMPRLHLLFNKYYQHINDNVLLYRFISQAQYFSNKRPSDAELAQFDELLRNYVMTGGEKILTTYDSLPKVASVLAACGCDLSEYKVVVDEMQVILQDAPIKAETEHNFYLALKKFSTVVYLSATPFLGDYLDQSAQFKDLTIYKLQWPKQSVKRASIKAIRIGKHKSIVKKCCEIIEAYKDGKGPVDEGTGIQSKEAVFYVNDVAAICRVIKQAALKPEEVNILCSVRTENQKKLENLGKLMGHTYERGTIPCLGEEHKMFTFCTSTVYVGSDFYSTNAYTYIMANPNVEALTLDVSTDIQQILGRQRLDCNPFKNRADFYYYLKAPFLTKTQNDELIQKKLEETQRHIENYLQAPNKKQQLDSMEALVKNGHKEQYCCISVDRQGNKIVVENELIWIAEKRSWDIANEIYSGDFSLCKALSIAADVVADVDSTDEEVQKVFSVWSKDNNFKRIAQFYCDLRENFPEVLDKCSFIPQRFHDYYEALGREGMEDLQWRPDYIKQALAPTPIDKMPHEKIAALIMERLQVGQEYAKEQVKQVVKDIYKELGVQGKPSATDIGRYVTFEEMSKRINRKKTAIIRITSPYRKGISLFNRITDVKKPIPSSVDYVLDLIKTGGAYDLKKKVGKIRTTTDKDEMTRLKGALPAAAWNGTFEHRSRKGCVIYSSFTALDFDHVKPEQEPKLKERLQSFACVYAYFRTPSGHGYKAIVLHDNCRKENHTDLYGQLLEYFKVPEQDTSTSDLGRGNYLSYDPDLWLNPNPVPYHYEPSKDQRVLKENRPTQTVVEGDDKKPILIKDETAIGTFLLKLSKMIMTDETIMNFLDHIWNLSTTDRGRNNTALSYAGVLCKAGVDKDKAAPFITRLLPTLPEAEIKRAMKYAYEHNIFGCERLKYRKRSKK